MDAKRKRDRRERIDTAIDFVQSEVEALSEDQRKRLESLGYQDQEDLEKLLRRKEPHKNHHKETFRLIQALNFSGAATSPRPKLASSPEGPGPYDHLRHQWNAKAPLRHINGHDETGSLQVEGPVAAAVASTVGDAVDSDAPAKDFTLLDEASFNDGDAYSSGPATEQHTLESVIDQETEAKVAFDNAASLQPASPSQDNTKLLEKSLQSWSNTDTMSISRQDRAEPLQPPTVSGLTWNGIPTEYQPSLDTPRYNGRCPEHVWDSSDTPFVTNRNRTRREAVMAGLAYTLALSYLRSPEVRKGFWSKKLPLEIPGRGSISVTNKHEAELEEKIEELRHRNYVLRGIRLFLPGLASIKDLEYPRYKKFSEADREAEAKYVAIQNDKLREILFRSSNPTELISQLCSALLSQRYTPNIHTFNLLIIGLCHVHFFKAAQYAITALDIAGLNHNEVTFAAILNCYIHSSRPERFRGYLNRMDGVAGGGVRVMLGKESASEMVQKGWASRQSRDACIASSKPLPEEAPMYREKAMRNQEVCNAIILGWLNTGNIERAKREYSSMLAAGLSTSRSVLEAFLSYSVKTVDWEIGRKIWDEIKATYRPVSRMTYYWMLQLCALCERPKDFELVLQDGLDHQILETRLSYENFELGDERRSRLIFRAFAIWRLEHRTWVPGLQNSDPSDAEADKPQPRNLYTMVLHRFLDLVKAKAVELGWFSDPKAWGRHAMHEARVFRMQNGRHSTRKMANTAQELWKADSVEVLPSDAGSFDNVPDRNLYMPRLLTGSCAARPYHISPTFDPELLFLKNRVQRRKVKGSKGCEDAFRQTNSLTAGFTSELIHEITVSNQPTS